MTPLIREMVSLVVDAGLDPTQTHWFDLTGVIKTPQLPQTPSGIYCIQHRTKK